MSAIHEAIDSLWDDVAAFLALDMKKSDIWSQGAHEEDLRAASLYRKLIKTIDFVEELAAEPCVYGDGCPDFVPLKHGKCLHCRAREALKG